jgi:2-iminobutanoate/2-iminopropanoate deaminase
MIASSSPREVISDGRPANPNLSAAIRAGNRVYTSGALGNTAENRGDLGVQTRETLNRLRTVLTAAGCSPADVVDSMVYITDVGGFPKMNGEYRNFFGTEFPARTTVGVGLVAPDGLVEIMMTAVKR